MSDESNCQSLLRFFSNRSLQTSASILFFFILILFRWLISLHPHSGEGKAPLFGDFEAQRHWMEITVNLPIKEWYWNTTNNDLMYWGLDYPPLTAYVSYFWGKLATWIIPESMALYESRGYSTPEFKVFMRLSVLVMDLICYFPAAYLFAKLMFPISKPLAWNKRTEFLLLLLLQPALSLIDNGHFQYNSTSLGLAFYGVVLLMKGCDFWASVLYSLSLNFKQISLYYTPAFTFLLLSNCWRKKRPFIHLLMIASAVILTFGLLWLPFCLNPPDQSTCLDGLGQEDFLKTKWPMYGVPLICLVSTTLAFVPSMWNLLVNKPSRIRFLLAMFNSSTAFFLFSYQVHEKSILFPLLPATLLLGENTLLGGWFIIVSTFSMLKLFEKDTLVIPYLVCLTAYIGIVWPYLSQPRLNHDSLTIPPGYDKTGKPLFITKAYFMISLFGIILLHLIMIGVQPPSHLPHIHDYLTSIYSCGHFTVALLYSIFWQLTLEKKLDTSMDGNLQNDQLVLQEKKKKSQ